MLEDVESIIVFLDGVLMFHGYSEDGISYLKEQEQSGYSLDTFEIFELAEDETSYNFYHHDGDVIDSEYIREAYQLVG